MRRRAALARAIALDPELLFLDEPTSGLDPISAAGFDELVQHLTEWLRLTIVIITHDLDSLWRIADRVAVLGNGKVLGIGTMDELSQSADPLIHEYFHGPRGRAAREQAWNRK
jgi:phospholipid/cholesterol/gamma-HCH transport system ATP-binding protein